MAHKIRDYGPVSLILESNGRIYFGFPSEDFEPISSEEAAQIHLDDSRAVRHTNGKITIVGMNRRLAQSSQDHTPATENQEPCR